MSIESQITELKSLPGAIQGKLSEFLRARNEQKRLQREDREFFKTSGIWAHFNWAQVLINTDRELNQDLGNPDAALFFQTEGARGVKLTMLWDLYVDKLPNGRSIWMGREVACRLRRDPEAGSIIGVIAYSRGSVVSAAPENFRPSLSSAMLSAGAGEQWPVNPNFIARFKSVYLR